MKRKGVLIWACTTHFLIDFICAWVITHQIPGTRNWDLMAASEKGEKKNGF